MSNPKNTRKCIVCKEHSDKSAMVRFVKGADGKITLDRTKKADGRGVWVHGSDACIQKLIKKRVLDAAFKCKVSDEIYGEINE